MAKKRKKQDNINFAEIVGYNKAYSKDFYDLNIEWLQTFFYVEAYDREVLSKPETYIIDKGGYIFFSKLKTKIVGTVALMPTKSESVFELTKMAVSPEHRGHNIGQQLMQYCIDFAKQKQIKMLVLYSNTKLENAIHIYKKYGFIEIFDEEHMPYKRSDIKMELNLNAM